MLPVIGWGGGGHPGAWPASPRKEAGGGRVRGRFDTALAAPGRALNMLKSQLAAFEQTGGFSERLTTRRLAAREEARDAAPAPTCPQCAQPMRRRKSAKGEFWGCSAYPECKGTKPM